MSASGDTIFALSTGAPPAGIAVVRVSGPAAEAALTKLAGIVPVPRRATLRPIAEGGELIDRGLVLLFPADQSATGEDVAEFHIHGGRAVVARLLDALGRMPGLRLALPGEFSRRAALNGRLSLAEAEALADLLAADTEAERRAAVAAFDGALGTRFASWREKLLTISAAVEALIDYDGEADVADQTTDTVIDRDLASLRDDVRALACGPSREELRDGFRVVLSGPPNAGKSSLLNALARREAALVTPIAGTTRDVVEVELAAAGRRIRLMDTAGLRDTDDAVEQMGVARAAAAAAAADLRIWLGDTPAPAAEVPTVAICARADLPDRDINDRLRVSSYTGEGLTALLDAILAAAPPLRTDALTLNRRQRDVAVTIANELDLAYAASDLLVQADHLRHARMQIDTLMGGGDVDALLDRLFAGFCLGK